MVDGGVTVEVIGSKDLTHLAAALKKAGDGDLRKALLKRIREAGKPILEEARRTAQSELPQSGGLADIVSGSKLSTRTSLNVSGASVRLIAANAKLLVKATDAGEIRHPVFGNRGAWVSQSVKGGWFTETAKDGAPLMRAAILRAMNDTARDIGRSV